MRRWIADLFTAGDWDRRGAAESFKRMCIAWGVVLLATWLMWNVAVVWA